jgi:asparagine synthase (glutamine-hydrolysing)
MGAVFGVVGKVAPEELDEMARRLAHRGTQSTWNQVAQNVHLGQIGPVARKPHSDSRLSVVIDAPESLDGATYDRILEVFLQSRRADEIDRNLRFPFTLAAWDESAQRLMLARDFLGLKPLHFCRLPSGGVAFATEYKALLAIAEVPAEPDLDAIRCLQMYKAMPAGKSLLAGIEPIPPGCVLHITRNGVIRRTDRMPDVPLDVQPMSEEQASEALLAKLETAMEPLVAGRSRIGMALSGGIDSMSVAYLARRCAPKADLFAFTAGEGPGDPEVHRAAGVMAHLNGHHEAIVVANTELMSKLPLAIWHMENPIGRSETFQFFALGKLARDRGFDFLLSGMGADLLFGGMPRHKVLWMAETLPFLRKDLLAFFEATQTGEPPARPLARLMKALYYRGSLPPAPSVINCQRTYEPELLAEPGPEFINRCLMLDGQEPTSRTLARIERPLQAHGIEYGSPYIDKSVIEFAFTIPGRLKIRRGVQKYILRRTMKPLMNGESNAPKELMRMGQNGEFAQTLQQLADRYLNADRVRRRGFFDFAQVEHIRRACRGTYHPETAMRLWTLIATEIWAEIYLDARGRCPMPAPVPAVQPTASAPGSLDWVGQTAPS